MVEENKITINKKQLSINIEGQLPNHTLKDCLDEFVNAIISAPSNYKKPVSVKQKVNKTQSSTFVAMVATSNLGR